MDAIAYNSKQKIYKFTEEYGIEIVRETPTTMRILHCSLNDDQMHLLLCCAQLIRDGHKLEFKSSY